MIDLVFFYLAFSNPLSKIFYHVFCLIENKSLKKYRIYNKYQNF